MIGTHLKWSRVSSATRRYTYGIAQPEDVAGIFIVLSVAVSAGVII